jgi:hypothetical protein
LALKFVIQRRQVIELHELVQVDAVGDDDEVVADALAGSQLRLDLSEERRVVLDDFLVVDLDTRLLGEQVQRRVVVLVARAHVHVQRPVREVERAGLRLAGPELLGGVDGRSACRSLLAAGHPTCCESHRKGRCTAELQCAAAADAGRQHAADDVGR